MPFGFGIISIVRSSPTPPPFVETDLVGWYMADKGVSTSGNLVTTLADQSAAGNDLTASGTARPTLVSGGINGLPLISFDGVANVLTNASITTGTDEFSAFLLVRQYSIGGGTNYRGNTYAQTFTYDTTTGAQILNYGGQIFNMLYRAGTVSFIPTNPDNAPAFHTVSAVWRTAGTEEIWMDNVGVSSAMGGTIGTSGQLIIGGNNYANIDLLEAIFFKSNQESQRATIEAYLKGKWLTGAAIISNVWPCCCPTAGSATSAITITGSGFTGATGAQIGGSSVTNFTVVNDTTITCTAPSGSAGMASVSVTNASGKTSTNLQAFAYLADCILQLHAAVASSITQSGGTVSKWADLSGNGNDFTQGTTANQPAYDATGMNSLPALFNAYALQPDSVQLNATGFPTSGAAGHLFGVLRTDPGIGSAAVTQGTWNFSTGLQPFPGGFGNRGTYTIYENFGSTSRYDSSTNQFGSFTPPDQTGAPPLLMEVQATASGWDEYVNGVHGLTVASNTVGWSSTPSLFADGSEHYGWISDVIVCTSIQSAAVISFMSNQFALRYGFVY